MLLAACATDAVGAAHYQLVDGTSFAAPIVSSVVAQMLEGNPDLTPGAVRSLLIATAERLGNAPALRQGYGVLNARAAAEAARREKHGRASEAFSPPRLVEGSIFFTYHDDTAERVSLVGEFNAWDADRTLFRRCEDGTWKAEIAAPRPGRYSYKLLVNAKRWVEDPANGAKQPDPYGAFNSVLSV